MFNNQVFRKCLVPVALAAVTVEAKEKNVSNIENEQKLCRPSELPLYTPDPQSRTHTIEEQQLPSKLEETIKTVRLKLTEINAEAQAYKRVGLNQFEKRKEDFDWVINYLRQEDNTLPKVGAIGIGALTGLIFGLRGGLFKKTLYMTTGALGMSAVCYPKEASEYSKVGMTEAKKYTVITYNFVNGVKKDDPALDLPSLPKLPTSFTNAWDSIKTTATSFISEGEEQNIKDQVIENRVEIEETNVEDPLPIILQSKIFPD
ncbi:MICOS complex subunit MIC27 isoform X1 [Diorhabda sublineata]|uniref:MICOS complex subunit MIC27 isoform X1 n=1 Tax=Diorhabda sublineata TaxID=1163346 RepID=UPI0024E10943|nr:MICOS complex subunit MIC27 isoform X1 [Diorhabda sublineata]